MNIWYIHPYAGSPKHGMSFRPYYLAKHFNRLGHKTTVISSSFHHLSTLSDEKQGYAKVEGVSYYFQSVGKYKGNGIKRLLNMLGFGLGLLGVNFRRFARANAPNVIIASTAHPFHVLAAKYYAERFNAKLILEVRDIWPLSLQELLDVSRYHPLCLAINFFQRYGYRSCDHCVSLLANAEEFFIREGLKEHSFSYIPNGVELSSKQVSSHGNIDLVASLEAVTSSYSTVIGYTGALGVPNNLTTLIKAASLFAHHNICVVLVGDGSERVKLEEMARSSNCTNVFFVGKVSKDDVKTVITYCDAMFLNAQPKPLYRYGISPNKIFDYMLFDKVVFNGIDSPGNPLELAGCEIRFAANDPLDLAKRAIDFHLDKGSYKVSASAFVEENHSYEQLAKRYIELMEVLVERA